MVVQADEERVDVFVSYKRTDRERVLRIVDALRGLHLSVWFDAALDAGDSFDEEISRYLDAASAQMVCWSQGAVKSRWVRSEAHIGAGKNILVPVFLEECNLLPPFNLDHTVDLKDWQGESRHEGWLSVLSRLGVLTGRGQALRRWNAIDHESNALGCRAFLADFPDDPLAERARAAAYQFELAAFQSKLQAELNISGESATPPTLMLLQEQLREQTKNHAEAQRAYAVQVQRLEGRLSEAEATASRLREEMSRMVLPTGSQQPTAPIRRSAGPLLVSSPGVIAGKHQIQDQILSDSETDDPYERAKRSTLMEAGEADDPPSLSRGPMFAIAMLIAFGLLLMFLPGVLEKLSR